MEVFMSSNPTIIVSKADYCAVCSICASCGICGPSAAVTAGVSLVGNVVSVLK
jgi:hypothetical protein